jgi:plastocyanin
LKLWLAAVGLVVFVAGASAQQTTIHGRVKLSRSSRASDAVVWLTAIGGDIAPSQAQTEGARRPRLLQKQKAFTPHLLVVPVGSSVEFPNQDPFFHNVFSLFEGKRFDLGLYEAGSTRSVVFDRAGISYIFCNIHPDMSAVVIALKTPYYGISDRDGNVVIPNVPAGTYELRVWHERAEPGAVAVHIQRIGVSGMSYSFGTVQLEEQRNFSRDHKNKYGRDYDPPTSTSPAYGSRP